VIVITVELWPGGLELGKETLGVAVIANDGHGTPDIADYDVWLGKRGHDDPHRLIRTKSHQWKTGRVAGFPRQRLGAWDLLYRALHQIVRDRNQPEARTPQT
jgi:hypothetical protein